MDIGRLLTAMVTPMTKEGEVDLQKAGALAKKLVQEGSDGLVVTGTTGEAPTLTHDEKVALWERVVDSVGDQAVVFAGSGTNDTAASRDQSREAERIGVHGVMLVAPYYNRPSQEGLYRHMATVADAVNLPVMVYNIPSRTGTNMEPDTVLRLANHHANVVAVKEASGIVDQVGDILRSRPKSLKVYAGDDKMTLPLMAIGAHGVVSVASHVAGPRIKEMMDAFEAGHIKKAQALHLALLPLFRGLFHFPSPTPVKCALRLTGFDCGPCRLPMVALEAEEEEWVLALLRQVQVV